MKKFFLILICSFTLSSIFPNEWKEEYKREITKEFSVSSNPSLTITSKFGNINILEGVKGKITFRIEITGKGNNEKKAQEIADAINVAFEASNQKVIATTQTKDLICNNCGYSVDYFVYVPTDTKMDFSLKYGNVLLGDASQPITAYIKYGNFTADDIDRAQLSVQYGTIKIISAKTLDVDIKYSHFTANRLGFMRLACAYSTIKSGYAKDLEIESKYDKLNFDSINNLTLSTAYSDVYINYLSKSLSLDIKYGKLVATSIDKNFSNIFIDSKYTDVKIGLNSSHSFEADLQSSYGKIKLGTVVLNVVLNENSLSSLSDNTKIMGTAGDAKKAKANVVIKTKYGNIIFI